MPLTVNVYGTDSEGNKDEDYCIYCFRDGSFTKNCTMDEMIEHCSQFIEEVNRHVTKPMTRDEYKKMMYGYFPMLKRWKRQ